MEFKIFIKIAKPNALKCTTSTEQQKKTGNGDGRYTAHQLKQGIFPFLINKLCMRVRKISQPQMNFFLMG